MESNAGLKFVKIDTNARMFREIKRLDGARLFIEHVFEGRGAFYDCRILHANGTKHTRKAQSLLEVRFWAADKLMDDTL